jgi:hypothetical protein
VMAHGLASAVDRYLRSTLTTVSLLPVPPPSLDGRVHGTSSVPLTLLLLLVGGSRKPGRADGCDLEAPHVMALVLRPDVLAHYYCAIETSELTVHVLTAT